MALPSTATPGSRFLLDMDAYTLEQVPISRMFAPPYQRPVGPGQLGRMLNSGEPFDFDKVDIITLSLRGPGDAHAGHYAIVDGNHRRVMCESLGVTHMTARVFRDLTLKQEARMNKILNTTKPPTALDRWRAKVVAEDADTLAIIEILGTLGLRVGSNARSNTPGTISCVHEIEATYIERGPQEFREIMTLLYQAWGYEPTAYTSDMVAGMRQFWGRYRDHVDQPRLLEQLRQTIPTNIIANARMLPDLVSNPAVRIGKQIAVAYTGRSRSPKYQLPEWKTRLESLAPTQTHGKGRTVLRRLVNARSHREPDLEEIP